MNTEKITISADADTSDIIKKMDEVLKKMKLVKEIGPKTNLKSSVDEKRFEEFKKRAAEDYQKMIQNHQKDLIKNLDAAYQKERDLFEQKKKNLIEENRYLEETKSIKKEIYDIESKLGDLKEPSKVGNVGKMANTALGILPIVSAIAKVADIMTKEMPMRRAERSAALAEKTYESSYKAMRGDSFRNLMFAEERHSALKDAGAFGEDRMNVNRATGAALGGGGAVLAALGAGALILGTGGVAAPAILGAGFAAMASERGSEYLTGNMAEIDKMTGTEMMDYFKKRTAAEEAKDMQKTLIKDFITENRADIIAGLRQSGMSEKDFFKNIQGTSQDFLFPDKMRMSQQILGAGGGSEAAFGKNMEFGLQLQRSMGVSNAGQLIGSLNSYKETKEGSQILEGIMAKAVTIGLDKSKYREEHKTYLTHVAEMARQMSGGESNIADSILAAMGGKITQRGTEIAAEQTKNLFNTISQSSGIVGAVKLREIASSDTFKNIKGKDRLHLAGMRFEDIEEGNEQLEYYYKKATEGVYGPTKSKEDFIEELKKLYKRSETGVFSDTPDGKKLHELLDKIKEGTATKDEITWATNEYSFQTNLSGPFADKKARMLAVAGKNFSTEDAEQQQQEYNDLKTKRYGGLIMGVDREGVPWRPEFPDGISKEEIQREEELNKGFPGRKDRPEGAVEGTTAANAIVQNQIIGGEKFGEVMADLAKSTVERLNMALVDKINLEGFNRALQAGATEAMEALVAHFSGRKPSKINSTNVQNSKSKANLGPTTSKH